MAAVLEVSSPSASPAWSADWTSTPAWDQHLDAWRATQARYASDDLGSDPDWCRGTHSAYPGSLRWVHLRNAYENLAVPLHLQPMELRCCLGEWCLACLHPRLLTLAGAYLGLPDDPSCYHAFFAALLSQRQAWDALRLTVPTASPFWHWLQRGLPERMGLRRYQPDPPGPHLLLEFPPSFADYTAKFTPKTRKNRERELRHLQRQGDVRLVCCRRPEDIEPFLATAGAISRRSYQHRLLRAGLREAHLLRPRLQVAAAHGWLRSYILWCGSTPCSFLLGYQYQGRYSYAAIGYDPDWQKWCVGTVLQWLVLQDMFNSDPPAVFDFGCRGPQKVYFGNREYEEALIYYFRPGLYPALTRHFHSGTRRATSLARRWLDQHGLKSKSQRFLRQLRGC